MENPPESVNNKYTLAGGLTKSSTLLSGSCTHFA